MKASENIRRPPVVVTCKSLLDRREDCGEYETAVKSHAELRVNIDPRRWYDLLV